MRQDIFNLDYCFRKMMHLNQEKWYLDLKLTLFKI